MEDFAQSVASNAKKQGQDVMGSFNPSQTQSNFLSNYNSMNVGQQGQTSDYSKRYADTIASNPTATDWYQRGNEQYNVEPLTQQAAYLQNQVTNQLPMQTKLMRGFDASQGQVDAAVNQNLRFLQPQATAVTNQAQAAQNLAAQYAQQGMAQNAINLKPVESEQQFILQQQANEAQAFIQANQQEMTGLVAKLNAGVALTEAEYNRYNQLLQAEASIRNAQTAAQASRDVANITQAGTLANTVQGQKYQTVPAGQNLVNTFAQGILNPATGQTRRY